MESFDVEMPWLSSTATPQPHHPHTVLCPIPKLLPLMLLQPTSVTILVLSNFHMHFTQGNTDSELVIPRSSRLFKRHILAMSPWRRQIQKGTRNASLWRSTSSASPDTSVTDMASDWIHGLFVPNWRTIGEHGSTSQPKVPRSHLTKSPQHQWNSITHQARSKRPQLRTINLLRSPTRSFRLPGY